jgi:putative flavoprotein involved in K+ transport
VIGGGQAGLSVSWHLTQRGIDHVVFERERVGYSWRSQRWDSFCLVTPNWQCKLPGFDYGGPQFGGTDPHGFMVRDDIVRYVEAYAASFNPPLHEGVAVTRLRRRDSGRGFALETSMGDFTADQVVVAAGFYHTPVVPRAAERLTDGVVQMHSVDYRRPDQLPPGDVLVVGSGQSGCQIAEDLHLAGRRVHLCLGGAPRTARFYRGRDVVDWLADMGHYDLPVDRHPQREGVRRKANHYVTGRDGGRDIDLRRFALEGMQLYGHLADIQAGRATFRPDLTANLDRADASAASIKAAIDRHIEAKGVSAPTEPAYVPPWAPASEPESLDLRAAGITSVIWSIGYRADFRWIEIPVFDGSGYPGHRRGVTPVEGLYFIGLPWLYTWGSGRFSGVGRDAGHIAERIAALLPSWSVSAGLDVPAFGV